MTSRQCPACEGEGCSFCDGEGEFYADDSKNDRLIPEGKVWEFHFEMSHAPQYVIQHRNGAFSGIYTSVESVAGDNHVPFGLSKEKVLEQKSKPHVEVVELPREQTPWEDGAYL